MLLLQVSAYYTTNSTYCYVAASGIRLLHSGEPEQREKKKHNNNVNTIKKKISNDTIRCSSTFEFSNDEPNKNLNLVE